MPYSLTFNKAKYSLIEEYLDKLSTLREGKTLLIETSSEEKLSRLKWLFYDYFHLTGTTSLYHIKTIANYLIIGTKKPSLSNVIPATSRDIESQFNSLIKELIVSLTPREYIKELLGEEEISLTTISILLWEYARIMQQ
uniref:Uncharacterized protein n=1 Tax=viral metagenome TaxID=1070528 RepID=A0A6H1ZDR5_9ZZZZ